MSKIQLAVQKASALRALSAHSNKRKKVVTDDEFREPIDPENN
jgi:hypothetical protein